MLGNSSRVHPKVSGQCHDRAPALPASKAGSLQSVSKNQAVNDGWKPVYKKFGGIMGDGRDESSPGAVPVCLNSA